MPLPKHIPIYKNKSCIYVENGYGNVLGFNDEDYIKEGIHVLPKEEVLKRYYLIQKLRCSISITIKNQIVFVWFMPYKIKILLI